MGSEISTMGSSNSKNMIQFTQRVNATNDQLRIALNRSSPDSVKLIAGVINETNQCTVESILHCLERKKNIRKNSQLFDLVQEYFSNSFLMSTLCNALEDCLKKTRDRQLFLHYALQLFKQEGDSNGVNNNTNKYQKALEELKKFKDAEDPFTEFSQILEQVYEQQQSMVKKLTLHHKKIGKKLRIRNAWWNFSNLVFLMGVATFMICKVLDVVGLTVIIGVAGKAILALSSLGTSMESYLKDGKGEWKREEELINSMKMRASDESIELGEIRDLVDKLEKQLQSLMRNSEFALRENVAVKVGFEEIDDVAVKVGLEAIGKSINKFTQTLEGLGKQAEKCSENLKSGRLVIQDKINRY